MPHGKPSPFVRENFVSQGMIADVAFHHMDKTNPHAHIMLTKRAIERGFSGKVRTGTTDTCRDVAGIMG